MIYYLQFTILSPKGHDYLTKSNFQIYDLTIYDFGAKVRIFSGLRKFLYAFMQA